MQALKIVLALQSVVALIALLVVYLRYFASPPVQERVARFTHHYLRNPHGHGLG